MRVSRIALHHAPGLPDGLLVAPDAGGLWVVLGPNASGKSTLARTVRGALWPAGLPAAVQATLTWRHGDQVYTASLARGEVSWAPSPPPLPAPEDHALYRLDLGFLLQVGADVTALAQRLATEMAGGYDLDAAMATFPSTPTSRPRALRQLDEARAAKRTALDRTDALEDLERDLRETAAALHAAQRAERVAQAADALAARAEATAALGQVSAAMEALPANLPHLAGHELDELEQVRQRLDDAHRHADSAAARCAAREAAVEALSLPAPLSEQAGAELGALALAAETAANEAAKADAELAEAQAKEVTARADVWASADPTAPVHTAAQLDQLDLALERHAAARARAAAAEQHVRHVARLLPERPEDPEALHDQLALVHAWLGTPAPMAPVASAEGPAQEAIAVGVAAFGALVALIGLACLLPAIGLPLLGALLVGLGGLLLGVGLARWYSLRVAAAPRDLPDPRAQIAAHAAALGARPASWSTADVDALARRLRDALARASLADQITPWIDQARADHQQAEAAANTAARDLAALVAQLGLPEHFTGRTLSQQAHALSAWRRAAQEADGKAGKASHLADQREAATARLARRLAPFGITAEDARAMAGAARAVVEQARKRRDAVLARDEALALAQDAHKTVAAAEAQHQAFWARVAPADDEQQLREHLALLPEFKRLRDASARWNARLQDAGARLMTTDVADLLGPSAADMTPEEARAARDAAAAEAAGLGGHAQRIGSLQAELDAARKSHALEDAITAVHAAAREAVTARDLMLRDTLARELIAEARADQAATVAPPLLERARGWLARFTRGAYTLHVDPKAAAFHAYDTALGTPVALEALSDGTRIQLLLAVRLAALEHKEQASGGVPFPLVLDEALATADPVRFRAVAAALFELVDAGRQVLYLTAQPGEAAAWRDAAAALERPAPVLVALGRSASDAPWRAPAPLDIAPPPAPAAGEHATAYANRLGVAPPELHRPIGAWDIAHLLLDDLHVVHAAHAARVHTVGSLRALHHAGGLHSVLGEVPAATALWRARALEAALEALRVGRPRPFAWEDVEASGGVTPAFQARLRDLAEQVRFDPAAFLRALESVPRFRADNVDKVREHFAAEGILTPATPLEATEVRARALAAVADVLASGGATAVEVQRYLDVVLGWLRA